MKTKTLDNSILANTDMLCKLANELGYVYFDYETIVNQAIRDKYTIEQELSIQRQRDTKPDEFAEYNAYAEECKAKAKEIWKRQEETIQRILNI